MGDDYMNQTATCGWEEANQTYLATALAQVRVALMSFLARSGEPAAAEENTALPSLEEARETMPAPPALETLCVTFGLSDFERKVLLACAGVELDSSFRNLVATALKDQHPSLPTFSLALAAFEDAHWSALLPERPLRHWHLVEIMAGNALTTSPLRIDESILHYLAGLYCVDERLCGLTETVRTASALAPSQQAMAEQVSVAWSRAEGGAAWPRAHLCGREKSGKRAVAMATCAALGMRLRRMSAEAVPRSPTELELFVRLWEREAALSQSALLLECDELDASDLAAQAAVKRLTETVRSPLLVSMRERHRPMDYSPVSLDVPKPAAEEQLEIWKHALGEAAPPLNGTVEELASQFSLGAEDIRAAAAQAVGRTPSHSAAGGSTGAQGALPKNAENDLASVLWEVCRAYSRPCLEGLAQRLEPAATWDDLVLPERQKLLLRQIALHLRQRPKVYENWGFASKGARGLGISALFAGPSGTGKTMAGEVLAKELRLDLYKVDLSQVVNKYIGETEKNLGRVFDAAEDGAAILLFDEADALFGKRSEVKDSHDRYANIEVSYLLQRMESYRGLAILTTNRKEALDAAFLRRIRFVVDFPFPDAGQRAEIWRRIFPPPTPTEGLRYHRLASLNAAGGNIRNIALGAAFLAADAAEPVRMPHLLQAARIEFAKLERPLTDSEIAGWV
jgi:ATPase family associated with various cellular activities (AAA)/Winged helix domain, variant